MPRKARFDVPGALHHIIVRGINKAPIFNDDQDKTRFLERLAENVIQGNTLGTYYNAPVKRALQFVFIQRDSLTRVLQVAPLLSAYQPLSLLSASISHQDERYF